MNWLKGEGGNSKSGIGADEERGMVRVIKLTATNGRSVIVPGDNQYEHLTLTYIDYLDRRLQVASPFRSIMRS
jgi:hypothetical protein